jgi:hypothetical protein
MPICALTGSAHMRVWPREGYHVMLTADKVSGEVRLVQTRSDPPPCGLPTPSVTRKDDDQ